MSDTKDISGLEHQAIRRSAPDRLRRSVAQSADLAGVLPIQEHRDLQLLLPEIESAPEVEYPPLSQLMPSSYDLPSSSASNTASDVPLPHRPRSRPSSAPASSVATFDISQSGERTGSSATAIALFGAILASSAIVLLALNLLDASLPSVYLSLTVALAGIALVAFVLAPKRIASKRIGPRARRSRFGSMVSPQRSSRGRTRAALGVPAGATLSRKISVGLRTGGFGLLVEPVEKDRSDSDNA